MALWERAAHAPVVVHRARSESESMSTCGLGVPAVSSFALTSAPNFCVCLQLYESYFMCQNGPDRYKNRLQRLQNT